MLETVNLKNTLILDIETVPQQPSYSELSNEWKELWNAKAKTRMKEGDTPESVYKSAGIFAEFGKIICISAGVFDISDDTLKFKIKSFYGDDEQNILIQFGILLDEQWKGKQLCAHNGKEFDYPYIARRCLINGLPVPEALNNYGKKPWEVTLLDTMELWKFGDHKNFTSLNLLAAVFGIPSPKDDIDGGDVWRVYWEDKDVERIKEYCQKDITTTAQVLLKYKGMPLIEEQNIIIIK